MKNVKTSTEVKKEIETERPTTITLDRVVNAQAGAFSGWGPKMLGTAATIKNFN